jgi:hypothetical protein
MPFKTIAKEQTAAIKRCSRLAEEPAREGQGETLGFNKRGYLAGAGQLRPAEMLSMQQTIGNRAVVQTSPSSGMRSISAPVIEEHDDIGTASPGPGTRATPNNPPALASPSGRELGIAEGHGISQMAGSHGTAAGGGLPGKQYHTVNDIVANPERRSTNQPMPEQGSGDGIWDVITDFASTMLNPFD